MVVCNGPGIRRDNRHVPPGDISYVPGRCPAVHFSCLMLHSNVYMCPFLPVMPPRAPIHEPLPARPITLLGISTRTVPHVKHVFRMLSTINSESEPSFKSYNYNLLHYVATANRVQLDEAEICADHPKTSAIRYQVCLSSYAFHQRIHH